MRVVEAGGIDPLIELIQTYRDSLQGGGGQGGGGQGGGGQGGGGEAEGGDAGGSGGGGNGTGVVAPGGGGGGGTGGGTGTGTGGQRVLSGAAGALRNLTQSAAIRAKVIDAGGMAPLIELLSLSSRAYGQQVGVPPRGLTLPLSPV
jgi:hypothetical protein